jgi:hypothetical protein
MRHPHVRNATAATSSVSYMSYPPGAGAMALRGGGQIKVTDIDSRAEIGLSYHDGDLNVVIPLTGHVSELWCQRYEALAQAKDVQARVHVKRDGPARLFITVPVKARGSAVTAMLDLARALLVEADAVDQSPDTSASPEAVVRTWWASQQA